MNTDRRSFIKKQDYWQQAALQFLICQKLKICPVFFRLKGRPEFSCLLYLKK